ncbi:MAG: hypothetical protein K2P94_01560 [Rhodospirillaceae bacterium]|nr:hypothetical protein [Rhodospirillaceae bacterium]
MYFVIVFGAGFLLGTARIFALAPRIGENLAVMLELPFMLAISWFASKHLIRQFKVVAVLQPRLVMGGLAFGLLMIGEFGVSAVGFGRTFSDYLASYANMSAILGLVGQLVFGLFPAMQLMGHK